MRTLYLIPSTLLVIFILSLIKLDAANTINYLSVSHGNAPKEDVHVEVFIDLIIKTDLEIHDRSIQLIDENWKEEYEIMLLELIYLIRDPGLSARLTRLLERKTDKSFGYNFNQWYEWIWNKEQKITPTYHEFKSLLHQFIRSV
ncbi:MAG: hypothetical protein AAFN93_03295 [Bacteroidota bacterium]